MSDRNEVEDQEAGCFLDACIMREEVCNTGEKTVNRMIAPDRQGALLAGQKAGRNAVCLTVVKGNMVLMSGSITENWSFNGERNLLS